MNRTWIFALMLAAALNGCGRAPSEEGSQAVGEPASMELVTVEAADAALSKTADAAASVAPAPPPVAVGEAVAPTRLLIYHADLRLKVTNLPRATASLDSLVRRNGAYLSASTETKVDGEWQQQMTIRVRPVRFETLLAGLGGMGTVEEKKLTTDDVTAQHADVSARLKTKRTVEQRYIALLGQAKKISEILEVEAKIAEVREEIESTESRLKTLNDEVSYSTISLVCYQPLSQSMPDAPMVSFASRIMDSFYTGWSLLTGLVIGLVALWPLLILAPGVWWLLRRWRKLPAKQPEA